MPCHSVCVSHPPLWKEPASKGLSELPRSQPSLGCQGPGLGPALTLRQPREADWAMNAPSPGASLFHRHPGSRGSEHTTISPFRNMLSSFCCETCAWLSLASDLPLPWSPMGAVSWLCPSLS
ncbi:hypothetical protein H8959_003738 [Pygathrix nigripes]